MNATIRRTTVALGLMILALMVNANLLAVVLLDDLAPVAVTGAQVDKAQRPKVALSRRPPHQHDLPSNILKPQLTAGMCPFQFP